MVGGMAMKEDEHRATCRECQTLERLGELRAALWWLECVEEIMAEEGLYLSGSLPEMQGVLKELISQIEEG